MPSAEQPDAAPESLPPEEMLAWSLPSVDLSPILEVPADPSLRADEGQVGVEPQADDNSVIFGGANEEPGVPKQEQQSDLTIEAAAKTLGLSRSRISQLLASGKLSGEAKPIVRHIWLISRDSVEAYRDDPIRRYAPKHPRGRPQKSANVEDSPGKGFGILSKSKKLASLPSHGRGWLGEVDRIPRFRGGQEPWEVSGNPRIILTAYHLAFLIELHRLGKGNIFPENEIVLAKRLGVSIPTIHRGWKFLQERGIVRVQQGRGVIIQQNIVDALFPKGNATELLFETHKQIELFLAMTAASHWSDLDSERMEAIIQRQREIVQRAQELEQLEFGWHNPSYPALEQTMLQDCHFADVGFHSVIWQAAREEEIMFTARLATARIAPLRLKAYQDLSYLATATTGHQDILTALQTRDPGQAAQAMGVHLDAEFAVVQAQRVANPGTTGI